MGQAELARKTYGGTTFTVVSIQSAIKNLKEEECQMQIVVNPGESRGGVGFSTDDSMPNSPAILYSRISLVTGFVGGPVE